MAPFLAGRTSVTTTLTVRPSKPLRIDNTYLLLRLHNRLGPSGSMNNHIIRSKWNYQYNGDFRSASSDSTTPFWPTRFTFLETTRNFNADFLITYLVHPSTALTSATTAIWKMCSCLWEMTWMGTCCTAAG